MAQCKCRMQNEDLAGLCIALGKAMHKHADQFLAAYGLTSAQFDILAILSVV